jgi:hypothetical protein
MSAQRRFPSPWTVEDLGSCFVVKDSSGQRERLFLIVAG